MLWVNTRSLCKKKVRMRRYESASSLFLYSKCPKAYYYKYMEKAEGYLSPYQKHKFKKGRLAHYVLELISEQKMEKLDKVMRRLPGNLSCKIKEAVSRVVDKIYVGSKVYCEIPFAYMYNGILIKGRIDQVAIFPNTCVVTDYKFGDVLDRQALQAQVYLRAVEYLLPDLRGLKLVFRYLSLEGYAVEFEHTGFTGELDEVIDRLKRSYEKNDFSVSKKFDFCQYCEFFRHCYTATLGGVLCY